MDYILQNMQYRYMENVIQQINRGAVQNVTKPSLSGTGFAHIFQQTQMAESGISAGDLDAIFEEASRTYGVPADLLKAVGKMESNFDLMHSRERGRRASCSLCRRRRKVSA